MKVQDFDTQLLVNSLDVRSLIEFKDKLLEWKRSQKQTQSQMLESNEVSCSPRSVKSILEALARGARLLRCSKSKILTDCECKLLIDILVYDQEINISTKSCDHHLP